MNLKIQNFEITWNLDFQDELFGVTPQLKAKFASLYEQANDKENKTIIDELIALTIEYPHVPMLKNYLSAAYFAKQQLDKAQEVNSWILEEHPTYLYAIINRVQAHIRAENFAEAERMLGPKLEIKALYPHRKVFHATEVISYYSTVIQYLCAIDNVSLAIGRYKLIKDIDPNSEALDFLKSLIDSKVFGRVKEKSELKMEKQIAKSVRPQVVKILTKNPYRIPKFNHREMLMFYRYGMDISPSIVKTILSLPRETLIADCITIFDDAEYNFVSYFENGEEDDKNSFLFHAMLVVMELNAVETLPKILAIFENNDQFFTQYFDESKIELSWQIFYHLGISQYELLFEYLFKPNMHTEGKIIVLHAIEQLGLHKKIKKNELHDFYEKIIDKCLTTDQPNDFIDSDFIAFVILDSLTYNFIDLLPKIKILYDKKLVSKFIAGKLKNLKTATKNGDPKKVREYNKEKILDIFELQDRAQYMFNDDFFDNEIDDIDEKPVYEMQPKKQQLNSPKVGRNEPCPCGSGVKFKKCCG